jgi:hypothetical protein
MNSTGAKNARFILVHCGLIDKEITLVQEMQEQREAVCPSE